MSAGAECQCTTTLHAVAATKRLPTTSRMELQGTVKRRELAGGLWRWTAHRFSLEASGIVVGGNRRPWAVVVDARAWRAADTNDPGPCGFDVDTVGGGAESYIAESADAAEAWAAAIRARAAGEAALDPSPEAARGAAVVPPPAPGAARGAAAPLPPAAPDPQRVAEPPRAPERPIRRVASDAAAEDTPEEPEDDASEKRSASPPPSTAQLASAEPELVEEPAAVERILAAPTDTAVSLARAQVAEDRARNAVAAEAASRTQVAAVREDLAALALKQAGDVEVRSQERFEAGEAVACAKRETRKWRERYEASEHSRLAQKGQLEELRRAQKQCARLTGRNEALEERLKLAEARRQKAEAVCDASDMRAVRLQQQLDIAREEVDLLRGAQSRQRRDRDRLLSTINRTDAIVYGGKARTPRPFFGSTDVPSRTRTGTRARSDQRSAPAWRGGPVTGPRSTRKHVGRASSVSSGV